MISTIGKNIKRIRTLKGMSAYRLSKVAGIGNATISQIESGKRTTLKGDTIEKIANALEASPDDIMGNKKILKVETEKNIIDIIDSVKPESKLILDNIEMTDNEKEIVKLQLSIALNMIRSCRIVNEQKNNINI